MVIDYHFTLARVANTHRMVSMATREFLDQFQPSEVRPVVTQTSASQ
jgi:hypothetical protein